MTFGFDTEFLAALGVPSMVTGICMWLLKKHIDKSEAERENKDKARKEYDIHVLRTLGASLALGEATAAAVQRIPDAHCNGDMHAALEYACRIKHEQKDFLTKQGIENLRN